MRYNPQCRKDTHGLVYDVETIRNPKLDKKDDTISPVTQVPIVLGMADLKFERNNNQTYIKLERLESIAGDPATLATLFFQKFENGAGPKSIGYNVKGYDNQVLKMTAIANGIDISSYIKTGRSKWDCYESTYDKEYTFDIMHELAGRGRWPKMDDVAKIFGIPSKLGCDGSMVQGLYDAGKIGEIRDYCSVDVLTTLLIFIHMQRSFGGLSEEGFKESVGSVRQYLLDNADENPHYDTFNSLWGAPSIEEFQVEEKVIDLASKIEEREENEDRIPF